MALIRHLVQIESCTPDCAGLECGPDPLCGESCGTCAPGTCQEGLCVEASSDAPTIVQFSSNRTTLTEDGTLVLSAIVTDPQGVDDVIGGTLESPTGALYASFATSASEGSYGANLDWNSIHQVDTIEFRVSKEIVLVAKFFDQAANATSRTLTIRLECSDAEMSACDASCIDLQNSLDHCGACQRGCSEDGSCTGGECRCSSDEACLTGTICRNEICVPGCRNDMECETNAFCDDGTCQLGCRDDTTCSPDQLCDLGTRDCRSGCNLSEAEPSNDHWIGSFDVDFADLYFLEEIETFQDYLYISEGENLVAIVDIGDPTTPLYAGTLQPSWYLKGLTVIGDGLWGKGNGNIFRYDLSSPASPSLSYAIYTGTSWSSPKAAGFAIDASGLLAVARYQDETTHYAWKLELYDTNATQATLRWSYDLPNTASIEDVLVTVNSDSVYLYRADQTLLWRFDTGSGVLGATPSLTEAPRFLRVFPSGLYVESASENGFYNITQGVLSRAAQLPLAYTHEMSQHGGWLLRAAGTAGLQLVNFESSSAPFIQAQFDYGNSVKDAVLSTGGLWLAEQPERLRRITTPVCFSN